MKRKTPDSSPPPSLEDIPPRPVAEIPFRYPGGTTEGLVVHGNDLAERHYGPKKFKYGLTSMECLLKQTTPCAYTFRWTSDTNWDNRRTHSVDFFDRVKAVAPYLCQQPWLVHLAIRASCFNRFSLDMITTVLRKSPNIQSLVIENCSFDHEYDKFTLALPLDSSKPDFETVSNSWHGFMEYFRTTTTLRKLVMNCRLKYGESYKFLESLASNRSILYLNFKMAKLYGLDMNGVHTEFGDVMATNLRSLLIQNTTLQTVKIQNLFYAKAIRDILLGPLHRHPSVTTFHVHVIEEKHSKNTIEQVKVENAMRCHLYAAALDSRLRDISFGSNIYLPRCQDLAIRNRLKKRNEDYDRVSTNVMIIRRSYRRYDDYEDEDETDGGGGIKGGTTAFDVFPREILVMILKYVMQDVLPRLRFDTNSLNWKNICIPPSPDTSQQQQPIPSTQSRSIKKYFT